MNSTTDNLFEKANALLDRLERLLPSSSSIEPDWDAANAFRWEQGRLAPVTHPHRIGLTDLLGIDRQKQIISQNTKQFVQGRPANNVLLTGSRGTGKSSLVKALLNEFAADGLRLIEVGKPALADLPHIIALVAGRPERFILYCDDLSFNAEEPGYQVLKAGTRRFAGGVLRQPADLCHLQPPSPDAGIDAGQSRNEICRRRDPSGGKHRGKNLAVGALRSVGVVLSVFTG